MTLVSPLKFEDGLQWETIDESLTGNFKNEDTFSLKGPWRGDFFTFLVKTLLKLKLINSASRTQRNWKNIK